MQVISRLGLLIGFLLTVVLASALLVVHSVVGTPFIPFDIFDSLVRLLPGSLITAGIENMVRVLQFLGLSLRESSKVAEQVQAIVLFLAAGTVVGSITFAILGRKSFRSILKDGLVAGIVMAVPVSVLLFFSNVSEHRPLLTVVWILLAFTTWGVALSWVNQQIAAGERVPESRAGTTAPAATVEPIDRRRFVIKLAGASAIITVAGVGVSRIVKTRGFEEHVSAASEVDMPARPAEGQVSGDQRWPFPEGCALFDGETQKSCPTETPGRAADPSVSGIHQAGIFRWNSPACLRDCRNRLGEFSVGRLSAH